MFRFDAVNLAALLFSFILPAAGCEKSHPQNAPRPRAQNEAGVNSNQAGASREQSVGREVPPQTEDKTGQRVAIPSIEGCERDNTTFFSGEVLSFKRTEDSLAITIRTDWNTTAELSQPKNSPEVVFRRDGKDLDDDEERRLEADVPRGESKRRATVWVCRDGGQKIIKVVEWETAGAPKLPGSAPSRQ